MSREVLRAVLKGDVQKLDALLDQGNDISSVTEKERWNYLHRILMSVSTLPSIDMINYLIELGVDVNAVDIYGNAPINYAARTKSLELIKLLIGFEVDVSNVNAEGVSPLRELLLLKPFDYDAIKFLIDAGADINKKNDKGMSDRDFAKLVASEDQAIVEMFGGYS